MRLFIPTLLAAPALAADKPYSTWMADSLITRGVAPTRWYTEATFYRSLESLTNYTSQSTYLTHLTTSLSTVFPASGIPTNWDYTDHQLDHIRVGSTLLFLATRTADPRYKLAADFLHTQLVQHQKRTVSGGFWHKDPKYPNQMWLDGLYMAAPFYAAYTALYQPGNATAWDDILLQFQLVEQHCRDPVTKMLKHGYDESGKAVWAEKGTGASPHVWIRAQGWYLMALVDVLEWWPREHKGYGILGGYYLELVEALRREQDASGGWWLVMDERYKGQKGNYIESSGTAMYTYGLLKGVRMGLVGQEAVETAKKAYGLMADRFVARNGTGGTLNWEGTVRVGSLDGRGDYQYYIGVPILENSLIGVGPFIMASVEMERASLG
ncbi:hypothetical protein OQA88_11611 [Cercophora sp. LCS_1]